MINSGFSKVMFKSYQTRNLETSKNEKIVKTPCPNTSSSCILSPKTSITPLKPTNTASKLFYKRSISKQPGSYKSDQVSTSNLNYQKYCYNFSANRLPIKKAVVVGLNYVLTPDILLRGGCNDATAIALTLVNLCDFSPENIILLIDAFPNTCYSNNHSSNIEQPGKFIPWKDRQPSRRNILFSDYSIYQPYCFQSLELVARRNHSRRCAFFYFAGHGIQVDDMSGWEGEGYDEAILPMDFYGEEVNAITAVMIRNILLNVSEDVQITIVVDCNGGQTMLDPTGTGKWSYIKGVKQRGVWPLITDATDKVSRASYDSTPWTDTAMKRRGARPRFVPGVDVNSTQELLDPTLQKTWSQCAIEAKMTSIKIINLSSKNSVLSSYQDSKQSAYHGVFTWCFLNALVDLMVNSLLEANAKKVTYKRLIKEIEYRIHLCRTSEKGLPKLNQKPELTFYRSGGSDCCEYIFWPFGGSQLNVPYSYSKLQSSSPLHIQEQQFLSTWEAEEQLRRASENRRKNDPTFNTYKSHGGFNNKFISGGDHNFEKNNNYIQNKNILDNTRHSPNMSSASQSNLHSSFDVHHNLSRT